MKLRSVFFIRQLRTTDKIKPLQIDLYQTSRSYFFMPEQLPCSVYVSLVQQTSIWFCSFLSVSSTRQRVTDHSIVRKLKELEPCRANIDIYILAVVFFFLALNAIGLRNGGTKKRCLAIRQVWKINKIKSHDSCQATPSNSEQTSYRSRTTLEMDKNEIYFSILQNGAILYVMFVFI